ncbi:MAG: tRNA lysidine(34) synthetase TilS [Bacteroidota bacterium]
MLKKFTNHITTNFPFLKDSRFYIAVSGGIDSMVLVHLFQQLEYEFGLLHCDFKLRGEESDADMQFIQDYAEKNNLHLQIGFFETKKIAKEIKESIQVTARNLRYNWFYEQMEENNIDFIATAHHLDDTLETFLINVSRGTGLDGLTGIPTLNDKIFRPLLPFSREEIENYAKANNIQWREDLSNASDNYLRNKIRHHLVPILKESNPKFLDSFQNTLHYLQQSKSMVDDASSIIFAKVCKEIGDEYHFDIDQLQRLENRNAYLFHWFSTFGFTAWDDIYNLLSAQSGKQVFSDTHVLLKNRNQLILSAKKEPITDTYFIDKTTSQVNFPLKFTFCNVSDISQPNSNCIFVDEDTLQFPLVLRKWEEADSFYPFGMKGKKKLSKYFKDEKMSLLDKSNVWLLCSDNQIIWVINKRQDERFKITENTTKILQISAHK